MGIGPTQPAWKAGILPLNYTRTTTLKDNSTTEFCCQVFLPSLGKIFLIFYFFKPSGVIYCLIGDFLSVCVFFIFIRFTKKTRFLKEFGTNCLRRARDD